jgi:CPA2 family monovalent cation:H+ antiporter-2
VISALAGYSRDIAIRAGILLGQGSEFGFAVLAVAITGGLLALEPSQPIIAAIILSMAISPLLIRYNATIAARFAPAGEEGPEATEAALEEAGRDLRDHVLLCGFGRTGQNLGQFLRQGGIPFIALEIDADIVNEARDAGEPVFLADSGDPRILELAGIGRARVAVISFTELKPAEHISRQVRELRPDIPLIIRTRDDRHLEHLLDCGADEVIPDTVESSIMLARHTLTALGENPADIDELLEHARQDHYARVRAFFHGLGDMDLDKTDSHHLHSIEILGTYHAVGRRIDAMERLQQVRIVTMRRNGVSSDDPPGEVEIEAGDVLVIEGRADDIQAAEIQLMSGL